MIWNAEEAAKSLEDAGAQKTTGIFSWVGDRLADFAFIVLGLVLIVLAIVMTDTVKNTAVAVATKAV